jgi:RNA polymerase sigma factor (sigma-70 family)
MNNRETRWADLLRRANSGDGAAYRAFLTEATPVLRRIAFARAIGMQGEVEDIVQETLMAIHTKRHTWRNTEPVTPWLYAIARYKAADAWRRRGHPTVVVEDLAEVLADEGSGDATAARDLGRLLSGIDGRSAGIVRAIGVEGESAGEVGERFGMTEGAVRVAFHRAMLRLRRLAGVGEERG